MIFRKERAEDIEEIEKLTLAAFENHPHHKAGAGCTEHLIIRRLRDDGALSLSLVAEDLSEEKNGEENLRKKQAADKINIIAHIAFSPLSFDGKAVNWLLLAPVSVLPARQRQGIGSRIIKEALRRVKDLGFDGVLLVGYPDYYSRFNFNYDHELYVEDLPPEYLLAQKLNNLDKEQVKGLVKFHKAFD